MVAKRIVESPQAMKALVGQELGVSDWLVMTQERINTFAEASGDHQWIHVDVERCKTDMPDGKTIAHGNLTFSVISTFGKDVLRIDNVRNGINYGSNKVRYTSPVQVGRAHPRPPEAARRRRHAERRHPHDLPVDRRDRGQGPAGLCRRDHEHRLPEGVSGRRERAVPVAQRQPHRSFTLRKPQQRLDLTRGGSGVRRVEFALLPTLRDAA